MRGPRTAMKSGPRLPQLEKALAEKRRPNTAINKINKLIKKNNTSKIAFGIRGLLCFHTNCKIFCSSSVKNAKMELEESGSLTSDYTTGLQ